MSKNILNFWVIFLIVFFFSCRYESIEGNIRKLPPPTKCDTLKSTYKKDIEPIIALNCRLSCHKPGALGSFLLLTDYEKVREAVKNGNLIESILHEINFFPMPKNKPQLSRVEIDKFLCWKGRGYPEN